MILRHLFRVSKSHLESFRSFQPLSSKNKESNPVASDPFNELDLLAEKSQNKFNKKYSTYNINDEYPPKRHFNYEQPDKTQTLPVNQCILDDEVEIDERLAFEVLSLPAEEANEKISILLEKAKQMQYEPLRRYQKSLNLSVESLMSKDMIKNKYVISHQNSKAAIKLAELGSPILNENALLNLIKHNKAQQIQELYQAHYFENCRDLTKLVLLEAKQHSNNGMLLNILYENSKLNKRIQQNLMTYKDLTKLIESVVSGESRGANPLKFLWVACKVNSTVKTECAPFILREINRLSINGKNFQNKFSALTFFTLKEALASKIILQILQISESLKSVIGLWVVTMLMTDKISRTPLTQEESKIDMSDIFALGEKQEIFLQYFEQTFPRMLHDEHCYDMFLAYQQALRSWKQKSTKSSGKLPNKNNCLKMDLHSKLHVQYVFPEDCIPLTYKFNDSNPKGLKSSSPKCVEGKLVENIMKGNYHSVVDYFSSVLVTDENQYQEIDNMVYEGRARGFIDPQQNALFVLKQIMKKCNYRYQSNLNLTQDLLNKTNEGSGQRQSFKSDWRKNKRDDKFENAQESKPPRKGIFKNSPKQNFSTIKDSDNKDSDNKDSDNKDSDNKDLDEKADSQTNHYEEYLKVVKSLNVEPEPAEEAIKADIEEVKFKFKSCKNFNDVIEVFNSKIDLINQKNLPEIMRVYKYIPIVSNITVLIKYTFLRKKNANQPAPAGLTISFESSLGSIEKDYGEYLVESYFLFPFPKDLYLQLLDDQSKAFNRREFKKIVAHLMLFNQKISDNLISIICRICSAHQIGVTLLEIINLINSRSIKISYDALKIIAEAMQKYRNMESDLLLFLKNYCPKNQYVMEARLFESYIENLVRQEEYEKLNNFLDTLRYELRAKQYKVRSGLSSEQYLANEKAFKIAENNRFNEQMFVILEIISKSLRPKTRIPDFIVEILDEYLAKKQTPLSSKDYGVGLIIYSQSEDKFLDLLQKVKNSDSENNVYVFKSAMRALSLFGRDLKFQVEKIFAATLYKQKINLSLDDQKEIGLIFKELDNSNAFTEYLEYLLRMQPPTSIQIKNLYYKILNSTSDDYSKSQISSFLDFIFNPNRENERKQYKNVKIEEEKKEAYLSSIANEPLADKDEKSKDKSQQGSAEPAGSEKMTKKEKKKSKKEKSEHSSNVIQSSSLKTSSDLNETRFVFVQKMSKRDLRNKPLRIFMNSFMKKYEPVSEIEDVKKLDKKDLVTKRKESARKAK